MRAVSVAHAVEHAEEAQVLRDGQVARQRRIDGGEVRARRARAARCVARSTPSMRIEPAVGSSTPRIMLMVVVLPAPFGPSRPTISPRARPRTTGRRRRPSLRNVLHRSDTASTRHRVDSSPRRAVLRPAATPSCSGCRPSSPSRRAPDRWSRRSTPTASVAAAAATAVRTGSQRVRQRREAQ